MTWTTGFLRYGSVVTCGYLLAGCVSTTVALSPSPQAPVCERTARALVLWAPAWRADQKDAVDRAAAAEAGLMDFFGSGDCFARSELRRMPDQGAAAAEADAAAASDRSRRTVVIAVRELGPVVRLLSSAALLEGGTEVVLEVAVHGEPGVAPPRRFSVHWRSGGPGVVRGVASLPGDTRAALHAGLQAGGIPK
jgi:hypothetical protein